MDNIIIEDLTERVIVKVIEGAIKGDKGDVGAQGIQGLKGDTGDQGIQGIQGEPGATYNDTAIQAAVTTNTNSIGDISTALDTINGQII